MSSTADALIETLRANHDRLASLVAQMDVAALTAPSTDTEWDISQVLSHLGSGAEIGLGTLRRALDPTVPAVPNTEIWDRWNAMSPLARLDGFLSANDTLVASYEALDDTTRDDIRMDMGFLPEPADLALALRFRLNEAALHAWDIAATVDPAATLTDSEAALLIDHIVMLLGWIGRADALTTPVALTVTTANPARTFGLTIADAVTLDDAPATADGSLSLPAEAWLRLATGRLRPDHTPADVVFESTALSLDDLRNVFPGY